MQQAAAEPGHPSLEAHVRAFTRWYTHLTGTLARGYLDSDLTAQQARVLWEIHAAPGCTAKEIQRATGIEQAHLSRLLARFVADGLVRRTRSDADGRAHLLGLTAAGRRAFAKVDRRAAAQAHGLVADLNDDEAAQLESALTTVAALLGQGDPPADRGDPTIRTHGPGDVGWLLMRHAELYARAFGYDAVFETYVADGLPPFLHELDAARDRLWIAESKGRRVGAVAVHHVDERPGWAKLRWFFVERDMRGRGLGTRLLDTAVAFARDAGYAGVFLWTVDDLAAARRQYERLGFALVHQDDAPCPWAAWGHEQRWELRLAR